MMTYPGAPTIYYGNEVGLEGGLDPDCRRGFPKDQAQWNQKILDYHRNLIALRHQYPVLRTGSYHPLFQEDCCYIFARGDSRESKRLIVAVNTAKRPIKATLHVEVNDSRPDTVVYGDGQARWSQADSTNAWILSLELPPRQGLILSGN